MSDPKYICFENPDVGPTCVLFPDFVDHSDVAAMVQSQYPGWKVLSAGFVSMSSKPQIYGRSSSLNKSCLTTDSAIIRRQMGLEVEY